MTSIFYSDVHAGTAASNKKLFVRFLQAVLKDPHISQVGALGDTFDLWRCSNARVFRDNADIIQLMYEVAETRTFIFLPGNHDFELKYLAEEGGAFPFDTVSLTARIQEGDHTYVLTHGREIDVFATMEGFGLGAYDAFSRAMCRADDTIGGLAGLLWGVGEAGASAVSRYRFLQKSPNDRPEIDDVYRTAVSPGVRMVVGMRRKDRLIFGHTHRPFVNKTRTVANTGSWVTESGCSINNTYVKIEGNSLELKRYCPGKTL